MKKTLSFIFTLISLICTAQSECYNVQYSTYGVIYGNEISQSFVACTEGTQVIVDVWLARWPVAANGDKIEISDQFGNIIGTHIIQETIAVAQISQGAFATQPALYTFEIDCSQLTIGNVYTVIFSIQGPLYYDASWLGLWPINLYAAFEVDQTQGGSSSYLPEIGQQAETFTTSDDDICMEISTYQSDCRGDCDGDGILTVHDLICLVNEMNNTCADMAITMDMDGDCDVDGDDVSLFKIHYGGPCNW